MISRVDSPLHLIFIRPCGWLVLLGRSTASKDNFGDQPAWMQLPLRDNTLHAIPPRPETKKSGPRHHYSRPPGMRSSRSSVAV
jgi:hypothetical protein